MSLRIPPASPSDAAAAGARLLVVGLCGEAIKVEWSPADTVGTVKAKAFHAAAHTIIDGSICSLVQGAACPQHAARRRAAHAQPPFAGVTLQQLVLAFGSQEDDIHVLRDEAQRLDEGLNDVR